VARILLVDDEEPIRVSLSTYLRRVGHDVTLAGNGVEALRALGEGTFDLVVTDVNMPDMDGIEVVMKLKEASSRVPLVVMSGGGLFDKTLLLDAAGALGADVTLEKPIDLDELRAAIERLV
jgi:DNA-binding response OmpR family regulator